jgi:hypothetical protein
MNKFWKYTVYAPNMNKLSIKEVIWILIGVFISDSSKFNRRKQIGVIFNSIDILIIYEHK